MAIPIQPKDRRGYFMLPQAPEDAGYYVYGKLHGLPGTGHLAQYAHPNMLSLIFQIEREWQAIGVRPGGHDQADSSVPGSPEDEDRFFQ